MDESTPIPNTTIFLEITSYSKDNLLEGNSATLSQRCSEKIPFTVIFVRQNNRPICTDDGESTSECYTGVLSREFNFI